MCEKIIILSFLSCFVVFLCRTGLSESVELPPIEFPKDNKTYKIYLKASQIADPPPVEFPKDNKTYTIYIKSSQTPIPPPHVFPENDTNYKIIKNMTILRDLVSHTSQSDKSEVPDLVIPVLVHENITSQTSTSNVTQLPTYKTENFLPTTEKILDMDQEEIESDPSKTEDGKKIVSQSKIKIHQEHRHAVRVQGPIFQGQLAAVLAAVFAIIAVIAYIGLLTWRRYLEHRYGNREMLINEEDHISYNDIKNFEI